MSGLEVLGIVAAIVSAFTGATTFFREWRAKSRERKQNRRNAALDVSLKSGSQHVQSEYHRDFARMGRIFAVGDERCQLELMTQLAALRQTVIGLLQHSTTDVTDIVLPNLPALLSGSDSVRVSVVTALCQQFQRLAQRARIQRDPWTSAGAGAISPRVSMSEQSQQGGPGPQQTSAPTSLLPLPQQSKKAQGTSAFTSQVPLDSVPLCSKMQQLYSHQVCPGSKLECEGCRAYFDFSLGEAEALLRASRIPEGKHYYPSIHFLFNPHTEDTGRIFCRVCDTDIGTNILDWGDHFETHRSSELQIAFNAAAAAEKPPIFCTPHYEPGHLPGSNAENKPGRGQSSAGATFYPEASPTY